MEKHTIWVGSSRKSGRLYEIQMAQCESGDYLPLLMRHAFVSSTRWVFVLLQQGWRARVISKAIRRSRRAREKR